VRADVFKVKIVDDLGVRIVKPVGEDDDVLARLYKPLGDRERVGDDLRPTSREVLGPMVSCGPPTDDITVSSFAINETAAFAIAFFLSRKTLFRHSSEYSGVFR
jgi:hypothetical protein